MRPRDNYQFLTQASVGTVIAVMAVPSVVSMLVTSLYSIADAFFVGQIDTQATAAVGIVFVVMSVIQAIGFLFGQGAGVSIAHHLGTRRHAEAGRMASTAFAGSVLSGVLIATIGQLFLKDISLALGSTPTILPYTERYLSIILMGAPFVAGALTLNNEMRFQGNAAIAMIGIVSGAVANILFDALFIIGFGWGIGGAAGATVVSQAISFFLLLSMTYRHGNIPILLRHIRPTRRMATDILRGGTPSLTRQSLGAIATACLNLIASRYGDAAIAGMTVVTRFTFFINSIIIGTGQGFQPLCGFCYGARLYGRVRRGFWLCVRWGTVFLVCCAVLVYGFAEDVMSVFRDDADVIAVGVDAFRWQVVTWPLCAFLMLSNMMMQSLGKTLRANIVAGARRGLFFIPLIFVLPQWMGLMGVEMCQAVADVCSFLLTAPLTYSVLRELSTPERKQE